MPWASVSRCAASTSASFVKPETAHAGVHLEMDGQWPPPLAGRAEHGLEGARRGDDGRQVVLSEHALLAGAEGGQHHDGNGDAFFTESDRLFDVGDGQHRGPGREQTARHRQRAMAVGVRLHHRHHRDGHEALQRLVIAGEAVEVDAGAGGAEMPEHVLERDLLAVHEPS